MFDLGEAIKANKPKESQSVVRLKTNVWCDSKGLHVRKDLQVLKRHSFGYQILEEDCSNIGALEVFTQIINFDELSDGIYEVVVCNESHDYESGHVDGYDYKLIKFEV